MDFLIGEQISFDIIILKGIIQFHTAFLGHKHETLGKFTMWESIDRKLPKIIQSLVNEYFAAYSGCLNVETIGGKIIEAHLRMGDIDQFPTFDVLKGIIETYQEKEYNWTKINLSKVYFFPIWNECNADESVL